MPVSTGAQFETDAYPTRSCRNGATATFAGSAAESSKARWVGSLTTKFAAVVQVSPASVDQSSVSVTESDEAEFPRTSGAPKVAPIARQLLAASRSPASRSEVVNRPLAA